MNNRGQNVNPNGTPQNHYPNQGYPQQNNQYQGNGYNGQNPQNFNRNVNNQNLNPMNRGPKMDSKMIGYITAAVAAILVVLMIFMFSSGSGKLGGATPEEAVKNAIAATKDGDFKKLVNNIYFESDEARTKALEQFNNLDDTKKASIELAKTFIDMIEIGEVKQMNENRAKVQLKAKGNDLLKQLGGDTTRTTYVKKVNGRWFIEDNLF